MNASVKWSLGFFDDIHHVVADIVLDAQGWQSVCGAFCIGIPEVIVDSEGLMPCPKCCAAVSRQRGITGRFVFVNL